MGRSTYCAVVPFVLKVSDWNNPILSNKIGSLREEDDNRGDGLGISWDDDGMIIPITKDGWKFYRGSADEYRDSNGNRLLCDNLDKDSHALYVVNESKYSSGGEESYCVFSNDRAALEELCSSWGLDSGKIRSNDVVQQTL